MEVETLHYCFSGRTLLLYSVLCIHSDRTRTCTSIATSTEASARCWFVHIPIKHGFQHLQLLTYDPHHFELVVVPPQIKSGSTLRRTSVGGDGDNVSVTSGFNSLTDDATLQEAYMGAVSKQLLVVSLTIHCGLM